MLAPTAARAVENAVNASASTAIAENFPAAFSPKAQKPPTTEASQRSSPTAEDNPMHKIHLIRVKKQRDILAVSGLAHTIWREHYASILSSGQIEYMLERFQSPSAIEKAIAEGYEYFLARRFGVDAGYVAIRVNEPRGKLFLSKFYLLKDYRGKGYATDLIAQLEETGKRLRLSCIWLTVNKNNPSLLPYQKMGFSTVREQITEIGGGYVMDDYVMEKPL